jgi:hypothetical protein
LVPSRTRWQRSRKQHQPKGNASAAATSSSSDEKDSVSGAAADEVILHANSYETRILSQVSDLTWLSFAVECLFVFEMLSCACACLLWVVTGGVARRD